MCGLVKSTRFVELENPNCCGPDFQSIYRIISNVKTGYLNLQAIVKPRKKPWVKKLPSRAQTVDESYMEISKELTRIADIALFTSDHAVHSITPFINQLSEYENEEIMKSTLLVKDAFQHGVHTCKNNTMADISEQFNKIQSVDDHKKYGRIISNKSLIPIISRRKENMLDCLKEPSSYFNDAVKIIMDYLDESGIDVSSIKLQ
ncbi:hypothetical protein HHI36_007755 [Cryptolaemus montrouzieri]|uniref:Uncharacterized protein n=1 Tax=Cryptolaemus montrouzieri TaxID=559131 RepID=A0ABD2MQD4_9CUCU